MSTDRGNSSTATDGINRQFHTQMYNKPLDQAQHESGQSLANLWPSWYRGFKRYATTTGLYIKDNKVQVNNLTNAMGTCADDILTTLRIDEDTIEYSQLIKKIEEFFNVRRNVLAERQKFNKRVQNLKEDGRQMDETIEEFINSVYTLAETCEYGTMKDEFIRDRIIAGVKDERLSDLLVQQNELTLEKTVELARKWEAREVDLKAIRGDPTSQISFVSRSKQHNHGDSKRQSEKCWFCAGRRHKREECPARNAQCQKCSKIGHFAKACNGRKSHKKVQLVESHEQSDDEESIPVLYVGEVKSNKTCWEAVIFTNGNETTWKLDTGAEACVLSDSTTWLRNQPLMKTNQKLRGPGGIRLTVLGMFEGTLQYKSRKVTKPIYVIKNQKNSLLSKSACVELGLIKLLNIDEVQPEGCYFKTQYSKLFKGLGEIKTEPYKISIKPDVKPFCLYTPRKIAHPLLIPVEEEINKMLEQGVISEVTEPTEWCAGIVPVPKKNNHVRICVDFTHLNRAVEREVFPMKTVDYNLALLAKSKIFSKLDAASGFWQLPLHADSRLLTTFITPQGRFCFNRLPFGISSAPEVFQRAMSRILDGIPGVVCHMDDVLIHAPNKAEHDATVHTVLKRLEQAGVTLNDKCEFSQSSIKFLGHVIDETGIKADSEKTKAIRNYPVPRNITELQRFNGMVNQLGKFIPHLADINLPLRQLLRKDQSWLWSPSQESAFQNIKEKLLEPPTLAHYDLAKPIIVAADACNSGIGAVLLQT